MDDITLEKITYKNYIDTIWRLKVKRCQKDFVASNNNSLAEAYVAITNGCVALPFAICKNNKPIGFLMIGYGMSEDDFEGEDSAFPQGDEGHDAGACHGAGVRAALPECGLFRGREEAGGDFAASHAQAPAGPAG